MTEVRIMLVGRTSTVPVGMKTLGDVRECALVAGFSLIATPDMIRYAGGGAGIKATTGGDKVAVDPEYKAPYSTHIQAVVLAVNNNAMSFNDRSGWTPHRRIISSSSGVVPENKRDPVPTEKIEGELAVVIRHLFTRFSDQDRAKRLLYEQQKSKEALVIKYEGSPLVDFCGYLISSIMYDGLLVDDVEVIPPSLCRYLYHVHLVYMRVHGLGKPITLARFGKSMPGAMTEHGRGHTKRETKRNLRSNAVLTENSKDWMSPYASVMNDDGKD